VLIVGDFNCKYHLDIKSERCITKGERTSEIASIFATQSHVSTMDTLGSGYNCWLVRSYTRTLLDSYDCTPMPFDKAVAKSCRRVDRLLTPESWLDNRCHFLKFIHGPVNEAAVFIQNTFTNVIIKPSHPSHFEGYASHRVFDDPSHCRRFYVAPTIAEERYRQIDDDPDARYHFLLLVLTRSSLLQPCLTTKILPPLWLITVPECARVSW